MAWEQRVAVDYAVPFRQVQEHHEPLRLELTQSYLGRGKNYECALETTRKTVKRKVRPPPCLYHFSPFFYQKGKIVSVNLSLNVFKSVLGSLLAHFLTVFKCDHGLEAFPFNF